MSLVKEFNVLCSFRQQNPGIRGSGLSVNDPILRPVKQNLEAIKEYLSSEFQRYRGINFDFEISKGQTYFPSILHVAILPSGQKVSNGIYVVMCFDIRGRGAVVGCAESITNPQGLKTVIRKRQDTPLAIDVDGLRSTTKYNNVFGNPKEFYAGLQSDTELIAHLKESLDIALYNLKLIDAQTLSIASVIVADTEISGFDPKNIQDAKEKIARQITARRGQKKFRNALLKAYDYKCAVSECDVEYVLEAAHIIPYRGKETNHVQNGLLLRSDIHLLFDLGLLTVDAKSLRVKIHTDLKNTHYYAYNMKKINIPKSVHDHPHRDALRYHNENEFREL